MLKYIFCGCLLTNTCFAGINDDFDKHKANPFERVVINSIMSLTTQLRNEENDIDKMVDLMLQIQRSCELFLEVEIDAEPIFDSVFLSLSDLGYKFHPNYLKYFKKKLKIGKTKHFNIVQKGPSQETIDSWTIDPTRKINKKKEHVKELNPKMAHGITASLVGGFLTLLPSPPLVKLGKIVFTAGVGYIIDGYFYDEEKKYENGN